MKRENVLFHSPLSLVTDSKRKDSDNQIKLVDFPKAQLSNVVLAKYKAKILELLDTVEFDFQDCMRTRRKVVEYGYSFQRMVNQDFSYIDPPRFLEELGNEICSALGEQEIKFTNYIISLYEPEFQIEPHYDTDDSHLHEYGFYFDEKVFGIVIEADPTGSLYLVKYQGNSFHPPLNLKNKKYISEKSGTVFLLKGKYRYKPYYHGVSNISKRRISVTFRTVIFK